MSDRTIARRYARALIEEAERHGITETVDADVLLIRESLKTSRELVLFFESPVISRSRKAAVVGSLFEERVHSLTLRFLRMLVEKRREQLLPDVVRAYGSIRDEQLGIVQVVARIAQPMDESEEKALTATIEKMTQKRVHLDVQLDSSLVGGLVVRVGDTVYDGSVANKLHLVRDRLGAGSYLAN